MDVDPSAMTEAGVAGVAATELTPGAQVAKYRLDRVLGSGGMGVVWAAFDPDLERAVAIKVLRSIDSVATMRTRLLREARAMARLKHPNILTVYEVGTDRNRDYIAMELIDGADLDGWLATSPPRAEVFAALLAAGRGLAAAHAAGLIHRDLKPHNILRGRDGAVYVTDFGLARGQIDDGLELVQTPVAAAAVASRAHLRANSGTDPGIHPRAHARPLDSVLDSPLTQTGMLIGTPAYMAPEQFAGRPPDPRSDQFAFCVTAWEALTGSRPFGGKTLDELRLAASAGAPAPSEAGGSGPESGLSRSVRNVLARGLAPAPADRWPDMQALLRALETANASRRTRPPRLLRLSGAPLVAAALVAAGLITGGAWYAMRSRAVGPTGACAPADEAFGSAWSAERRKTVTARHRTELKLVAAAAMLDRLRTDWIKSYEKTCAVASSEERHEQLACLFEVRDDINEVTQELVTDDAELSLTGVIPLDVALGACKHP
jgi:serine/threonine protein kinase